jgi:hypothetical protein
VSEPTPPEGATHYLGRRDVDPLWLKCESKGIFGQRWMAYYPEREGWFLYTLHRPHGLRQIYESTAVEVP